MAAPALLRTTALPWHEASDCCGTPRQRQGFHGRRIAKPLIVGSRKRVSDREGDTIAEKGLSRVVTLVDRKPGLLRMHRIPHGEAATVMRAIVHAPQGIQRRVRMLTRDNGSKFAEHAVIDIALQAKSHLADSYSFRQRGTNENAIGLVRHYFPKTMRSRYAL